MNQCKKHDERFWRRWRKAGSVKFSQNNHPEIQPGEVWITNADEETFWEVGWKSKRRGQVAYGNRGQLLNHAWPGAFPVFAQRQELLAAGVHI